MSHELVLPAEYARRRGCTRQAVSKAIERCPIPLVDGRLDPLVADTLWKARTDPDQQRRALAQNLARGGEATPGGEGAATTIDWRLRRESAEAQLAELELREREGTLVQSEDVERAAKQLASAIVQQFASIPDRIAAEFGTDDAQKRKLRAALQRELDQVRAEFGRAGLLASQ